LNEKFVVNRQVDVLIIGGGLTGASLLLALAHTGLRVLLVEQESWAQPLHAHDPRNIALAPASVRILEQLQLWPLLEPFATPVVDIHISEAGAFGSSVLNSPNHAPLGFVVEMHHIHQVLVSRVDPAKVLAPAQLIALDVDAQIAQVKTAEGVLHIEAALIVAADGSHSPTRRFCGLKPKVHDYAQQAIVSNITLARSHGGRAFERFLSEGVMAFLPLSAARAALIWTMPHAAVQAALSLDTLDFLNRLQQTFGYRLGRFIDATPRASFPLKQQWLPEPLYQSIIFVGNAAQTLHPVAGQGFNLGLRDVAMLAQCIVAHGLSDKMREAYKSARQTDKMQTLVFTDGLIRLFSSHMPGVSCLRRMGLLAFDKLPGVKPWFSRQAQGFGGIVPDLACGIPLRGCRKKLGN